MVIEKIVVGEFQTNCYIVGCEKTGKGFIIDPGDEHERIKEVIEKSGIEPSFIVNTHGHMDHIKDDSRFNLPVYIHPNDVDCLTNPARNLSQLFGLSLTLDVKSFTVEEGDILEAGELSFQVLHTPGHSPGSICLRCGNIVFTGDTLFCGGYGRTDLPCASEETLFKSINEKLLVLPEDTIIHPGHGPFSTIGEERAMFEF
ncbi:MAG TPA: MBL fold metallo-hydrolase [bacterium]|nr:MBL fold metallo-hydrolase [bacterium]HPP29970.1 MBL fold metallo-hydrolase [bacterium]